MGVIARIPGARLLIGKSAAPGAGGEALPGKFRAVADLVGVMATAPPRGLPSHWIRVINIVLQFIDLDSTKYCGPGPPLAHVCADEGPCPPGTVEPFWPTGPTGPGDYYNNCSFFIAGDPTGSVLFIAGPGGNAVPLAGGTFAVLNAAVVVINGRLCLQAVDITKFVPCGHANRFINRAYCVTSAWRVSAG